MVNKKNTINNTRKRSMIKKTKVIAQQENNSNESTKNYKFKIGFDQSVSSGVISIHGDCYFTDADDGSQTMRVLENSLEDFEGMLRDRGYLVASLHAPKKNGKTGE